MYCYIKHNTKIEIVKFLSLGFPVKNEHGYPYEQHQNNNKDEIVDLRNSTKDLTSLKTSNANAQKGGFRKSEVKIQRRTTFLDEKVINFKSL